MHSFRIWHVQAQQRVVQDYHPLRERISRTGIYREHSGNRRSEQMMILWRDVCTRRYLMSAEHEFSIRCEGQISGNGPGIEPSSRRKRQPYAPTVPRYRLTVDFPNLILYDRGNKRNSGEKRAYKWKIRQR